MMRRCNDAERRAAAVGENIRGKCASNSARPSFTPPHAQLLDCRMQKTGRCWELHSRVKFGAVAAGRIRTCFTGVASVIKGFRINNPKGTFMKCASVVKVAAAVAAVAGMVGCTDLKPIQAQIDDLKAQVAKTSSD